MGHGVLLTIEGGWGVRIDDHSGGGNQAVDRHAGTWWPIEDKAQREAGEAGKARRLGGGKSKPHVGRKLTQHRWTLGPMRSATLSAQESQDPAGKMTKRHLGRVVLRHARQELFDCQRTSSSSRRTALTATICTIADLRFKNNSRLARFSRWACCRRRRWPSSGRSHRRDTLISEEGGFDLSGSSRGMIADSKNVSWSGYGQFVSRDDGLVIIFISSTEWYGRQPYI